MADYKDRENKNEMTDHVLHAIIDEKKNLGEIVMIRGWLLSSVSKTKIEIFNQAGNVIDASIERHLRSDAYETHKEIIKETDLVGFVLRIPTQDVANGIVIRFSNEIMAIEEPFSLADFAKEASFIRRIWRIGKPKRWREHINTIKIFGKSAFGERVRDELNDYRKEYNEWIKVKRVGEKELERQRVHEFAYQPKISIVIPLYNTPLDFLRDIIDSVCAQSYVDWELCLADGSDNNTVKDFVRNNYGTEGRIIYEQLAENKGISENTNQALKLASGDFIMFSDHDDKLEPDALFLIVKEINMVKDVDIVYTDEDMVSMQGDDYYGPHFKPDFNLRMLEENNYICHIFVVRKEIVDRVGMLRSEYDGAQDYDMILRCVEIARQIRHIPKVLYHWRAHPQSTAGDPSSKHYAYEAGRAAVAAHYDRIGVKATVESTEAVGRYRTHFEIVGNPKVSILIPNKDHIEDLNTCVQSIIDKTSYSNYEIIIIENNSEDEKTAAGYEALITKHKNIRLIKYEGPFNYAAINNYGAKEASGEYLLFLNNDTEVINGEWLTELVQEAIHKDIGIVGGKLYYPDDTIQHAGVVIGLGGVAGHIFCGLDKDEIGYAHRNLTTQDVSAVTAACMLMKKSVFDKINGFDEQFVVAYNDVDLCLRTKEAGYRVIFTPYAQVYHYESKTRGKEEGEAAKRFIRERKLFCKRWGDLLKKGDPYYNINLTRVSPAASLRV